MSNIAKSNINRIKRLSKFGQHRFTAESLAGMPRFPLFEHLRPDLRSREILFPVQTKIQSVSERGIY
jgi:hypothetical protein